MADNFQINVGTQTTISSDDVGGVQYPTVKLDQGASGVSNPFTGTILAVTNIASGTIAAITNVVGGTITRVNGGSIVQTAGTVTIGSIDTLGIGRRHPDEFATVVSSGTSDMGTIKPAVSGSVIYVTSLVISAGSATNVMVGNGGTGLFLLGTIHLNANGGVALMPINPPLRTTAGSALVYKQSANIPLSITATGFVD